MMTNSIQKLGRPAAKAYRRAGGDALAIIRCDGFFAECERSCAKANVLGTVHSVGSGDIAPANPTSDSELDVVSSQRVKQEMPLFLSQLLNTSSGVNMVSNLNRAFGRTSLPGTTGAETARPPAVTTTRKMPSSRPAGAGVTALAQLKALGDRLTPAQRTSIEMMEKFSQMRTAPVDTVAPDTQPRKR